MIESAVNETPQSVASHYDDLDVFYREIWGLHVHHGFWKSGKETSDEATLKLLDHLFNNLPLNSESKICDIGCGYGGTSRWLVEKYNASVVGYSVSKEQLNFANNLLMQNPTHKLKFVHQDWLQNQLESNSHDLLFSIESSEHMPNIQKFFQESFRILKPGGTLKVCAWLSKENPKPWEFKHFLQPICTEGRMRLCTVKEYKEFIEDAGFKSQSYEDISSKVKKTWTLCLGRFAKKFVTDPKYIKFFLKDPSKNKNFLNSLLRIRIAYETGSMEYGIFTAVKS